MRPYGNEDLLNAHTLGGTACPGVTTISGLADDENWNTKSAKGKTGATDTLEGKDPREFDASVYIADDEDGAQFDLWDSFRELVNSTTNGPKPKALPIYHPDVSAAGITEVTKKGIKGPAYDGKGGATYVIRYKEYKPPKPKPVAVAKAGVRSTDEGTRTPPPYDPNAAAKAELQGLLTEARKPL